MNRFLILSTCTTSETLSVKLRENCDSQFNLNKEFVRVKFSTLNLRLYLDLKTTVTRVEENLGKAIIVFNMK